MEHIDGLVWRKARASGGNGGACVEVGRSAEDADVRVRDTKSRERGMLQVNGASWQAFLADAASGKYDMA